MAGQGDDWCLKAPWFALVLQNHPWGSLGILGDGGHEMSWMFMMMDVYMMIRSEHGTTMVHAKAGCKS